MSQLSIEEILSQHQQFFNDKLKSDATKGILCPNCSQSRLVQRQRCQSCPTCNYSACGI